MKSFTASFVVATLVAALLTPAVRRLAFRLGAVATPGGRHVHRQSVPRLGGVAICLAFFTPLFALYFIESSVARMAREETPRILGLAVGSILLCGVGATDDTRGVRALHKLLWQVLAATIAFAAGFRIDAVSLPLVGVLDMGIFALPVTIAWVVGIVNAVNLIDGLDGLAAGVVFFAGLTNFVVAYLTGSVLIALAMASMLGAVLGFLFYNFNPARIFMGDSGSYFLGFVLATTCLLGGEQKTSTAVSLLVPVVAMGVPIFDTLFAMVRRFLERRSIFSPDRGHLHHRLLDMGITHRRAVLILYGISVVFTMSAIGISLGKSWQVGLAMFVATVVLVGLVRFLRSFERVHAVRRQAERLRPRDAELLRFAVLGLPGGLGAAKHDEQIFQALAPFGAKAELEVIEILPRTGDGGPVFFWERAPASSQRSRRECVSVQYPLGHAPHARADVRFAWFSDVGEVSPQAEILLQVSTDMVAAGLERVGSRWAAATSAAVPALTPIGAVFSPEQRLARDFEGAGAG